MNAAAVVSWLRALTIIALLGASFGWVDSSATLVFRNANIALAVVAMAVVVVGGLVSSGSRAVEAVLLLAALVWLECSALTHYWAFNLNAFDFSIFDWMVASTVRGSPGYSPVYEVNHLGVHSSFVLLAFAPLHWLSRAQELLVVLGPLLVWLGVFPLLATARALGVEDGLSRWALAIAYLANAWVGRLVNGGFRIESLVPLLCLTLLYGWVTRRTAVWALAVAGLLLTKEDSALYLGSFFVVAAVAEREQRAGALAAAAACVAFGLAYSFALQPWLTGGRSLPHTSHWDQWGATPAQAVRGMLTRPLTVAAHVATSGAWQLFAPALFVPWCSRRAAAAMLPSALILSTATYETMHAWASYYPTPLVPFALFGLVEVLAQARRDGARLKAVAATVALLLFPLFGSGYARAVPWEQARLEGMAALRAQLGEAPVYAQSSVFPHIGYPREAHVLVDLEPLPAEAMVIANPALGAWPLSREDFARRIEAWRAERPVREFAGGFLLFGPAPQRP